MARIVIIGGGTAGTIAANRLRRAIPDAAITVIDRDDTHLYQPGLLFVPFGLAPPSRLVRPRRAQLRPGVDYVRAAVDRVDVENHTVHLDSEALQYDVLVIASGAVLVPEETEGLTGDGWMERVFTFYSLDGAAALAGALARFTAGRIAVAITDLPIKCPVAPLEFCFLADWFFSRRGVRADVEITLVTPLDGAFTQPVSSERLGHLLAEKKIALVTEFNTSRVDGTAGALVSYDDRDVPFDLAVVVPLHAGASYVGRSPGLGDALNFVRADPATLESLASPDVFVVGDAADIPASKAGSVAHFEGEVLTANVRHRLAGEAPAARFDGHANCFIESGFNKALLVDFNYDTEPLPGRYPGRVGLPLLRESRLNHLGKIAFEHLYWHVLLPGRDIPGLGSSMPSHREERASPPRTIGRT